MEGLREAKEGMIIFRHVDKGFGFIKGADDEDIFFHAEGVINAKFEELKDGLFVSYREVITDKGRKKAIGVTVTDKRIKSEVMSC